MSERRSSAIAGFVKPGFEPVREAFEENFARRHEIGAACCVYHRGEKVVDLWGGVRNKATGEPWEADTMVLVFSTTKGLSALAMALAESRGLFRYDERVCTYWPEFAQNGKEKITIRQLLAHQAALFAFDEPVDKGVIADLDRLAGVMARQRPAWEPGTRQAYHGISLGFYQGELMRRVDPRHRTLGQFFQDEIATPLGIDVYIRLPEEIPDSRLATLQMSDYRWAMFHNPIGLTLAALNPHSPLYRAMVANPGTGIAVDPEHIVTRNFEVPSGGGVGSARGIARVYGVFATGGRELGLRPETLQQLMAPAVPALNGFHDEVLKVDAPWSLGFIKPAGKRPFGHPGAFGTFGAGGSFGYADPEAGIGYGYVLNRMGTYFEDPRDIALRAALYRSIGETPAPRAGRRAGTRSVAPEVREGGR